jgi:hypothetical protein
VRRGRSRRWRAGGVPYQRSPSLGVIRRPPKPSGSGTRTRLEALVPRAGISPPAGSRPQSQARRVGRRRDGHRDRADPARQSAPASSAPPAPVRRVALLVRHGIRLRAGGPRPLGRVRRSGRLTRTRSRPARRCRRRPSPSAGPTPGPAGAGTRPSPRSRRAGTACRPLGLPLIELELAGDRDLVALAEVLHARSRLALEALHVKEQSAVAAAAGHGQPQSADVGAALRSEQLGIARQATDQVHAVHRVLLRPLRAGRVTDEAEAGAN